MEDVKRRKKKTTFPYSHVCNAACAWAMAIAVRDGVAPVLLRLADLKIKAHPAAENKRRGTGDRARLFYGRGRRLISPCVY